MTHTTSAPRTIRTTLGRPTAVGLLVVAAGIIGAFVHRSAPVSTPSEPLRGGRSGPAITSDGAVNEVDGALPEGVTVFDDEYPGVANLDPALLHALRGATTAAAAKGIELHLNSGWRSPEYQDQLYREAVAAYGSEDEAARWVATSESSAHVSGDAVDVGPPDAAAWLSQHGSAYGLCQVYRHEPWHYELRPEAFGRGCPAMDRGMMHVPGIEP